MGGLIAIEMTRQLKTQDADVSVIRIDPPPTSRSHSGNRVLHAFARDRRLGVDVDVDVDVEAIRPLKDLEQMAAYAITPRGRVRFFSLPQSHQIPAFFSCWTRKEAFMKAVGVGLLLSPQLFEMAFTANEPPALQHLRPHRRRGHRMADQGTGCWAWVRYCPRRRRPRYALFDA